jgi:hypothetical protein
MTTLTKHDGSKEPFDRKKIEESIRKAGADDATAKEIARSIPTDNITSLQIRSSVVEKLRERSVNVSHRYSGTIRLAPRTSNDVPRGVVLMAKENLNRLNVKTDEMIQIRHGNLIKEFKAEAAPTVKKNEICINTDDCRDIGITDGNRIITTRRM